MHQRRLVLALTGCLAFALAPGAVYAQTVPAVQTSPAAPTAPADVHWTLQVVQDGSNVDEFSAVTPVGQSKMVSRERTATHAVGCANQPAAAIKLSRTLIVAPVSAASGVVTLAIDAHEVLEEPGARATVSGCTLPPQPREVNANHPGLAVPDGQWVSWPILDKDPSLVYRVRAATGAPTSP